MSVRVMSWAFDRAPTTNPTDQLVLIAIADRCNDDGLEAWPSIETLSRKTRLSERAVWGALQRLKQLGVLVIRHGSGKKRSNHYEVRMIDRTTCDLAPRAISQEDHHQDAGPATTTRTTCDLHPAPRANDPSSTSVTSGTSEGKAAAPAAGAEDLQQAWNAITNPPIPRCLEMGPVRRRTAEARLRDRGLQVMRDVFGVINGLPFCQGENDRGWRATFDWALKPANITKVLEGNYAMARPRATGRTGAPPAGKYAGVSEAAAPLERAS